MKKILLVTAIAACGSGGGGSGVDGSALIVSLSSSQRAQECQYLFDTYPSRTVMCSASETLTFGETSVADCETTYAMSVTSSPNCTATVAEGEACIQALYELSDSAACSATSEPAACAAIDTASCSSAGRFMH